jgi:hypothetical protein
METALTRACATVTDLRAARIERIVRDGCRHEIAHGRALTWRQKLAKLLPEEQFKVIRSGEEPTQAETAALVQ